MSKNSNKKRTKYHHGDLRNALLDEGERYLSEYGVEGLSLRQIARACGVSQTAPYRHFNDKDSLISALAIRSYADLFLALKDKVTDHGESLVHLQNFAQAYVTYGLLHPHRLRLMFEILTSSNSDREKLSEIRDGIESMSYEIIEDALQNKNTCNASIASAAFLSMIHGYTINLLLGRNWESTELDTSTKQELDIIINALLLGYKEGT